MKILSEMKQPVSYLVMKTIEAQDFCPVLAQPVARPDSTELFLTNPSCKMSNVVFLVYGNERCLFLKMTSDKQCRYPKRAFSTSVGTQAGTKNFYDQFSSVIIIFVFVCVLCTECTH